jgi:magnesium transporter
MDRRDLATAGGDQAGDLTYPDDSVGRIMEPPHAALPPTLTVEETIARIREIATTTLVTYVFVVDGGGVLRGVVAMRELLLAGRGDLRDVFRLQAGAPLLAAAREAVARHFPVYPVCDAGGRLVGLVRGPTLFEVQALEISAQPGAMVGVEKAERISTPWPRSLRARHPWLQLNLLTAFMAAGVVGAFQAEIARVVVLAVFLPVLAGQSGNTGCQALAVTLRGLTLGELRQGGRRRLILKEALLGALNGALVGMTAGLAMYVVARSQGNAAAGLLAGVVLLAMIGSCLVSGIAGVLIPLTLERLGADPATASSIFLTTATDVASMGLLLSLATLLVR